MAVQVVGDVRHECLRCSGSCQGAVVVLGPGEIERVAASARRLGVEAVDGGRLRQERGRCVLLAPDGGCRLHAELGPEHKPKVCRQYPIVAVRIGEELRVGIDPGCYTHARTWRTGPLVASDRLDVALLPPLPAHEGSAERALLALLAAEGQTVAGALGALTGHGALSARVVAWVQEARLERHVAHEDTPGMLRETVGRVVAAAQTWDRTAPPALSLSPEQEAFALDVVHRTLFLRLYREMPVAAAALLGLTGAMLVGWACQGRPEVFGPTLAGWARAIRSPSVLAALVPEPTRLRWLATGD